MTKSRKINIASYRVLKTFSLLFENNLTMNELIFALNTDNSGSYNNFVISKYINTCKSCGIDIQKINGKYSLINTPFGAKFLPEETELLFDMETAAKKSKTANAENIITNLIQKLHLNNYKSSYGIKSSENYRLIKYFEKACVAESEVYLIYKTGERIQCLPKEITTENKKMIFKCVVNSKMEDINPDDLADIKLSNDAVRKTKLNGGEVIYELSGKLAKRYQLRENEQVIRYKANGTIVISNKYEKKEQLFRRLMRYDSLCKIIKPQEYVNEFKKILDDTLNNYK